MSSFKPFALCGVKTPIRGQTPQFRYMYNQNVPMADVSRNKQRLVRFEIFADSDVPSDKATTCAKLIMDVLASKVAPFVPIKMVYGLSEDIISTMIAPKLAVVDGKGTSDSLDYGIILYVITADMAKMLRKMRGPPSPTAKSDELLDQLTAGFATTINDNDIQITMKDPFSVGGLHCLVALNLNNLLTEGSHFHIMHETLHCWSMWHEFSHPVKSWEWSDKFPPQAQQAMFPEAEHAEHAQSSETADLESVMLYELPEVVFANDTLPFDPEIFTNARSKLSDGDKAGLNLALRPLDRQPGPILLEQPFGGTVRTLNLLSGSNTFPTILKPTMITTSPLTTRPLHGYNRLWVYLVATLIVVLFALFQSYHKNIR
jgi:hypothetical protein